MERTSSERELGIVTVAGAERAARAHLDGQCVGGLEFFEVVSSDVYIGRWYRVECRVRCPGGAGRLVEVDVDFSGQVMKTRERKAFGVS